MAKQVETKSFRARHKFLFAGIVVVAIVGLLSPFIFYKPAQRTASIVKPVTSVGNCMTTNKTVNGAVGVTLSLHIVRCYTAGKFSSTTATYSYHKTTGGSYYYAQMNRGYDPTNHEVLYNSSISYSYKSTDGPIGSEILILNANVATDGTLSFNQNNGG